MNWVGGARKRVKLQGEKKLQKEFFERKKFETNRWKKCRRSPLLKPNSVSRDLLALQTVSKIQYSPQDVPKFVRKLDLDQFRSTVCGRRYNEVELPSSPNETPSMIHLYENGCLSSDGTPASQRLTHKSGSEAFNVPLSRNTVRAETKVPLKSNKMSSQCNNPHSLLYPFEQNFNHPSSSVSAKKSYLKPPKSNLDRYQRFGYQESPSYGTPQCQVHQTSPKGFAFDPWAVEDFQATPLVKYECHNDKKVSRSNRDSYKSLKDPGYITDHEKFHKPASQIQTYHKRRENPRFEPISMEAFEISLDHNLKKSTPDCKLGDSVNDRYDGYIENRFKGSKRPFPKTSEMRNHVERPADMYASSKPKQFCNNRCESRRGDYIPSHSEKNVSNRHMNTTRKCVDKQDMNSIFSDTMNIKLNSAVVGNVQGSKNTDEGDLIALATIKREKEIRKKTSPIEGDLPNVSRVCPENIQNIKCGVRNTSSSIRSVGSASSSCSDTRISSIKDDFSDYDWDAQGVCVHADLPINSEQNKYRLKTSSVDEILEEFRKLESDESEDTERDDEYCDCTKASSTVTATAKSSPEVMLTSLQDETELTDDDDEEEVNQILQELVHKVVLLISKQVTYHDMDFVIPSRSITPWRTFKSSYTDTTVKCPMSPVTPCQPSAVYNKKDAPTKVQRRLFDVACTSSSNHQKLVNPESCHPSDLVPKMVDCAVTCEWNKLNLVSPLTKLSKSQSCGDPSVSTDGQKFSNQNKMNYEEKILPSVSKEIFTPKRKYESLISEEKVDMFMTPSRSFNTCAKQSEMPTFDLSSKGNIDPPHPLPLSGHTGAESQSVTESARRNNIKSIMNEEKINPETTVLENSVNLTVHQAAKSDLEIVLQSEKTKSQVSDQSTQTYSMSTCDASTSPIQFTRTHKTLEQVDAATQCVATDDNLEGNASEMSMEVGDIQEMMDCSMSLEVCPVDRQWTVSDSMLESESQTDAGAGYSLRSRRIAAFPTSDI